MLFRSYFEPLTPEDVTGVVEAEKPDYAIVQFGGQTAINLAAHLEKLGVPILGTPAWSIDAAEDREKFDVILEKCGIPRPAGHTVMTEEEAVKAADELGYPVLVRRPTFWAVRAWRSRTRKPMSASSCRLSPATRSRTRFWSTST